MTMAIHRPPCPTWQDHVQAAIDRDEIGFTLRPFLDRFDEERQAEDDEIEPRDDNPWDGGYARESGRNL
uniref:Uncharacterized protein n=1 Tax=viral metagenome TaxID=1070528 RepID=A0A6M3JJP7_9ZZZZ